LKVGFLFLPVWVDDVALAETLDLIEDLVHGEANECGDDSDDDEGDAVCEAEFTVAFRVKL
jgi:hypothetical protein